jgi:formylmethanofuran dehydrogenase subunit E
MKTNSVPKSFATPSAKPNDVEYRLRRASEVAQELAMFLNSIDPSAFGSDSAVHAHALAAVREVVIDVAALKAAAPEKGRKKAAKQKPCEDCGNPLTSSDVERLKNEPDAPRICSECVEETSEAAAA